MNYILAYAVTFIKIGMAVIQQKNVELERKWLIPPTSMVMQCVECLTWGLGVTAVMNSDWLQIVCMGLGAGSGSLVALWINRNWIARSSTPRWSARA